MSDFNSYLAMLRGGYSGAQALNNGDAGSAIGSAARVGQGASQLLDFPAAAQGFGAVGGPLALGTGIASGDPLSAAMGGLQTASMASGYLGGPTIGSALSSAYGALPGAVTGGAASAGMGLAGSLGLLAAPFALTALGVSLFDPPRTQAMKQADEYKKYAQELPGLIARRRAGAGLFDQLGEFDTPDEVTQNLAIASSGRSANPDPAAWNVGHTPSALHFDAPDTSSWFEESPTLGGQNWGSFLNLMDKGQNMGLDTGGMTGDWGTDIVNDGGYFVSGKTVTGGDYRNRPAMTIEQVQNIARGDDTHRDPMGQTREAEDLGNAVGGIGRVLGVNFNNPGEGDYQNFDSDQIGQYGFTPGNYGPGVMNYLRSVDPNVVNSPLWGSYTQALGDPSSMAPLQLSPRRPPMSYPTQLPELNLGGM